MPDLPSSEVHINVIIDSGTIVMNEDDALGGIELEGERSFTADDVVAALQQSGSKHHAIDDWSLVDPDDYRFLIAHKRWELGDDGQPYAVITRAEW